MAIAAIVSCGLFSSIVPAHAAQDHRAQEHDEIMSGRPTRVIDRSHERMARPIAANGGLAKGQSLALDARSSSAASDGVTVKPGERVQVNYQDGIAIYGITTANCGYTVKAWEPIYLFRFASSGHTLGLDEGCAYSQSRDGILIAGGNWWAGSAREVVTVTVSPGETRYWEASHWCKDNQGRMAYSQTGLGGPTSGSVIFTCSD